MGEVELEVHWATLAEAMADALPDADALVQGSVRRTWRDLDERAAKVAAALLEAGVRPGSKVAQYLYNSPEYAESYLGALKVRAVPVNVNYRYLAEEVRYLLENSDAEVLLYHSSLADRVAAVRHSVPGCTLIEVDDTGAPTLEGALRYDDVISQHAPATRIERSGADPVMIYTGGTTGMPKGVMGTVGRSLGGLLAMVPPLLGAEPLPDVAAAVALAVRLRDEDRRVVSLPACPLMHATGLVIGMLTAMVVGGTVALLPSRRFDPDELWEVIEAEGVSIIAVVGDPFARPMLRALEAGVATGRSRDLASLRFISSSGAMFSREVKEGLLAHLPQVTILDYISSTEGLMGVSISTATNLPETGVFRAAPGVEVLDEDGVAVVPGSGQQGIVALTVGVPDGYYKDPEKSAATFREVGGVRRSFPGDWATVDANGAIRLLGRGSQCINTGGEKVFPEEVEEVVKRHDGVADCLVFGIPDERFGQRIVAVASSTASSAPDSDEVIDAARSALSSYKLPRQVLFVDEVPRTPAGKADYVTARRLFEESAGR